MIDKSQIPKTSLIGLGLAILTLGDGSLTIGGESVEETRVTFVERNNVTFKILTDVGIDRRVMEDGCS